MIDTKKAKQHGQDIIAAAEEIERLQKTIDNCKDVRQQMCFLMQYGTRDIVDDIGNLFFDKVKEKIEEDEKVLCELMSPVIEPAKKVEVHSRKAKMPSKASN